MNAHREDDDRDMEAIDDFVRDHGNDPMPRAIGILLQNEHRKGLRIVELCRSIANSVAGLQTRINDHEATEIRANEERMNLLMAEIKDIHRRLNEKELAEAKAAGAAEAREEEKAKGEAAGRRKVALIFGILTSVFGAAQGGVLYVWNEQVTALKALTAQVQKHEIQLVKIEAKQQPGGNGP